VVQALHVNGAGHIDRLEMSEARGGPTEADVREYPLAMVEWQDAWFDLDQLSIEDRRPDYLVRTVGFLIDEGP